MSQPAWLSLGQYAAFGVPIKENSRIPTRAPVIRTHSDCPCTAEFRLLHDAWLLERFGEREVVYMMGGEIFCSPDNARRLRECLNQ